MGLMLFVLSLVIAVLLLASTVKVPAGGPRKGMAILALLVIIAGAAVSSVTYVPSDKVGIVNKNALGGSLKDGKIIAVDGEMGVQADVLPPGWHFGFWPVIYSVRNVDLIEVPSDKVGLLEAADGIPLESDQLFAPDFQPDQFQQMLDARYFLTTGKGYKGKQASVLKPGKYRINSELFRVTMKDQTEIKPGEVGVLKANYGKPPA